MITKKIKLSYEPEADVLAWEVTKQPIDYAEEVGNVVIHYSKKNTPVLMEILEASKFLSKAKKLVNSGSHLVKV
jgi:hypothetical protein